MLEATQRCQQRCPPTWGVGEFGDALAPVGHAHVLLIHIIVKHSALQHSNCARAEEGQGELAGSGEVSWLWILLQPTSLGRYCSTLALELGPQPMHCHPAARRRNCFSMEQVQRASPLLGIPRPCAPPATSG
jgi:hypothetical protein